MAIRLYMDAPLIPQARLKVNQAEWTYFSKVRRQQGPVILFNRQAQEADAVWDGDAFVVGEVRSLENQILPIDVAVALPERKIVEDLIPSLSECGARRLILFPSERSQSPKQRLKDSPDRWERMSLESCRQSGRGRPLEVEVVEGIHTLHTWPAELKIVLDEASGWSTELTSFKSEPSEILLVVGCEGGWTQSERLEFQAKNYQFCHFCTPILKVGTAAVAGYMSTLQKFFPERLQWSFESSRVVDHISKRS